MPDSDPAVWRFRHKSGAVLPAEGAVPGESQNLTVLRTGCRGETRHQSKMLPAKKSPHKIRYYDLDARRTIGCRA